MSHIALIPKRFIQKKSGFGYSMSDITANMINTITSHLAMSIDMPATPRAPKTAAMMARTKNAIAKLIKPAIFYTLLDNERSNTDLIHSIGRFWPTLETTSETTLKMLALIPAEPGQKHPQRPRCWAGCPPQSRACVFPPGRPGSSWCYSPG